MQVSFGAELCQNVPLTKSDILLKYLRLNKLQIKLHKRECYALFCEGRVVRRFLLIIYDKASFLKKSTEVLRAMV